MKLQKRRGYVPLLVLSALAGALLIVTPPARSPWFWLVGLLVLLGLVLGTTVRAPVGASASAVLPGTPEEVFDLLVDPEALRPWRPKRSQVRMVTPGPPGLGSVVATTVRGIFLTATVESTYTVFQPGRRLVTTARSHSYDEIDDYELRQAPGGTALTLTVQARLGLLSALLLRLRSQAVVAKALHRVGLALAARRSG